MKLGSILILFAATFATGCSSTSSEPEPESDVEDNRPANLVRIDAVTKTGELTLSDGRVVRLFGLDPEPEQLEVGQRAELLAALRNLIGRRVSVEECVAGPVPGVDLKEWHPIRWCGTTPTPEPSGPAYRSYSLSRDILHQFPQAVDRGDLGHPQAPAEVVEEIRDAVGLAEDPE